MPRITRPPRPSREFAIVVDPADNVAVVKTAVEPGLQSRLADGREVVVTGTVTPGHRFATRAIPAGELVLQYGQPIGTSRGIAEGDPITPQNMSNDVPVVRDLPADLHTPAPRLLADVRACRPSWDTAARTAASARATSCSSCRPACARATRRSRSR